MKYNQTNIMTSNRIDNYLEITTSVENTLPPNRKTVAILTDSKGGYLGRNVSNVVEADIHWWSKKAAQQNADLIGL